MLGLFFGMVTRLVICLPQRGVYRRNSPTTKHVVQSTLPCTAAMVSHLAGARGSRFQAVNVELLSSRHSGSEGSWIYPGERWWSGGNIGIYPKGKTYIILCRKPLVSREKKPTNGRFSTSMIMYVSLPEGNQENVAVLPSPTAMNMFFGKTTNEWLRRSFEWIGPFI